MEKYYISNDMVSIYQIWIQTLLCYALKIWDTIIIIVITIWFNVVTIRFVVTDNDYRFDGIWKNNYIALFVFKSLLLCHSFKSQIKSWYIQMKFEENIYILYSIRCTNVFDFEMVDIPSRLIVCLLEIMAAAIVTARCQMIMFTCQLNCHVV